LLGEERNQPNGMGGRAVGCFAPPDRVRDVVLVVCARDVHAIPARGKEDLHMPAAGALAVWERIRLWLVLFAGDDAGVGESLVRFRLSVAVGRAGDHAETLGEWLIVVLVGATIQVVHGET